MAHTNQSRHTSHVNCTQLQWLQLGGSLKLQGSFAKEPCKRDYILQKRPIILRRLQISRVTHYESRAHNCTHLAYIAGRVYPEYEWVMSHMNESCHAWMSHVTYAWVMEHTNTSRHTSRGTFIRLHAYRIYHTYEWVMSHRNESWHIQICHVTHDMSPSHNCTRLAYITRRAYHTYDGVI